MAQPLPDPPVLEAVPQELLDRAIASDVIVPDELMVHFGADRGWLARVLGIDPKLLKNISGLHLQDFTEQLLRGIRALHGEVVKYVQAEVQAGRLPALAHAMGVSTVALHFAMRDNRKCDMEDLLEVDVARLFPEHLHAALFTVRKAYKLATEASSRHSFSRRWVACCSGLLQQKPEDVVRLRRALLAWVAQQRGVLRVDGYVEAAFRLNPDAHLHAGEPRLQECSREWFRVTLHLG